LVELAHLLLLVLLEQVHVEVARAARGATSGPNEGDREHRLGDTKCNHEDGAMAHGSITDEELAELIRRTAEATSAFIRGDMSRYLELTPHARGFTLMNPVGGVPHPLRQPG
jgi:hypothetical protein